MQLLDKQYSQTQVVGAQASRTVGLSATMMQQMSRFFRDQIYSNKPLAAIRETICNAVDEHMKHGIDRLVEVHLPTPREPYFSVRDYGKGLDEEGVLGVFFQYGESTKSQDRDAIGGFGIGAKAPFAYVKEFFVTSWHGGEKKIYLGVDQGQDCSANLAHSEKSDEPTGIEVKFDIEQSKISHFNGNFANFYGYFQTYAQLDFKKLDGWEYFERQAQPQYFTDLIERKMRQNPSQRARVLHKGIVYDAGNVGYGHKWAGMDIYVPDTIRLEIQRSRESIEGSDVNINMLNGLVQRYADERMKALDAQYPTDDFDIWVFSSKNAEEINFLRRFGYKKEVMPAEFNVHLNIRNYKTYSCRNGNCTPQSGYRNLIVSPTTKILFLNRMSMTEGLLMSLKELHGDNWFAVCRKLGPKELDPQTKNYRYADRLFTMQDMIKKTHEKTKGIDVTRLFHDCTQVVAKPLPKTKKERAETAISAYVTYGNGWGLKDVELEDTELNGRPIYFVELSNTEIVLDNRQNAQQFYAAVDFICRRKGVCVVGVRKKDLKLIPEHWHSVRPLLKAMRRNAHKAGDWAAKKVPLEKAEERNLLDLFGLKMPEEPKWPFQPIAKKILPPRNGTGKVLEAHRTLKKTNVEYAMAWALWNGIRQEGESSFDFELGKSVLEGKIKDAHK